MLAVTRAAPRGFATKKKKTGTPRPVIALLPVSLFAAGALAIWVASQTYRRRSAPGADALLWMMAAVGWWCVTGACHAMAETVPAKIVWAKVQYLGIASVPALWLMFAAQYAHAGWFCTRRVRAVLWVIPIATVLASATNEAHQAIWTSVRIEPNGATVYGHGWFFWLAAAYHYVLMLTGTILLIRALRQSPPPFRGQWVALIVAALFPWAGNLL